MSSYDLVVIGSGPGGYAAAMAASRRGLRTALVEREQWGGVCLNIGCIPTKALLAVAHLMRQFRQAPAYGIQVEGLRLDFPAVMARNRRIIGTLSQGLLGLLRAQRVELLTGSAALEDAHTVVISREGQTEHASAQRLIFATGAGPAPGPWPFDGQQILSYRELLSLSSLPRSLLIIGGGVIGCEFASCFAAFGVPVTIIEQQPQILPADDPEAVRVLARALQSRGVTLLTGASVQTLKTSPAGVDATLIAGSDPRKGSDPFVVTAERCVVAVGITPNSRGLGLEGLGIGVEGGIEVNEFLLTAQPHIAAIGDCVPEHGLAHLASAEGILAVHNLCERTPRALDRLQVPRCAYTDPELAHVGLTEAQAPPDSRVSRCSFAALGKSLCDEEPDGFVKLIVEGRTERLLGATMVGAQASSLIHLAVVAMRHGLTAKQLAQTVTAHPTLPEAVTEAAAQIYGEALFTMVAARAPRRA